MQKRRSFLKAAGATGAVGLTGLSGCIGSFGSQPYGDGTLTFVMSPSEPQKLMNKQYEPVKEYLGEQVSGDVDVELQYAQNYSAVLRALGSGNAEIAETGPFAAALGVKGDQAEIALQRFAYGSWSYSSVLVTNEDSDISSLEDLEGKTIAFADTTSASGSLYPLFMLKKRAGLSIGDAPLSDEGADFDATWSSHASAFQTMMEGQADAAGVGRFITLNDEREYKDGVVELDRYKGIPRAPVIVSPELSDDKADMLTEAMADAPDSMYLGADGEEGTDDDLWFSKVRPADLETYKPVIDVANELGIEADLLDQQGGE